MCDLLILQIMPGRVVVQRGPEGISLADAHSQGLIDPFCTSLPMGVLVDNRWWVFNQDPVLVPADDSGVKLPLIPGDFNIGSSVHLVAAYLLGIRRRSHGHLVFVAYERRTESSWSSSVRDSLTFVNPAS